VTAPRLLLISDAAVLPTPRLVALVERLAATVEPGVVAVYLREPGLPAREQLAAARALVQAGGTAVPVFVRRRVDLASAAGAAGVHLQADGLLPAEVRTLSPGLRIGYSAHAVAELALLAAEVDYATFAPVFASPGKGPARGLEALRAACAATDLPVLALGGMLEPAQVRAARAAGAWGVAAIRGVLASADPVATTQAWLAELAASPRGSPGG
jgi:thiamine-phosphate pyrophosphorylase